MRVSVDQSETNSIYSAVNDLKDYIEKSDCTGYVSSLVLQSLVSEIEYEMNKLISGKVGETNDSGKL